MRARAIASRASVTVSMAADTTGIASSSSRVRRVRVETSFGSTSEAAGTSSTSSNASPSLANLSSSARRRSTSIRPSSSPSKENSLASVSDADLLEIADLDVGQQRPRLLRVEAPGAHLQRRRRSGRDRAAERVVCRAARRVGGDERGEQHIAAADHRDHLDLGSNRAIAPGLPALAQPSEAAGLVRDQHVARAQLGDVLQREREVLPLVELLTDQRLGLALVGRDEERLRLQP